MNGLLMDCTEKCYWLLKTKKNAFLESLLLSLIIVEVRVERFRMTRLEHISVKEGPADKVKLFRKADCWNFEQSAEIVSRHFERFEERFAFGAPGCGDL